MRALIKQRELVVDKEIKFNLRMTINGFKVFLNVTLPEEKPMTKLAFKPGLISPLFGGSDCELQLV